MIMICPKCGNDVNGKWCSYCGTQLETDDNFNLNPYDTNEINEDNTDYEPDFYTETEPYQNESSLKQRHNDSEDYRYQYKKKSGNGVIIVLSVFVAILLAIIITILTIQLSGKSPAKETVNTTSSDTQADNLFEKGKKYMDIGDYESSESIFKQLMDSADNDEATIIYQILYNYNRAVKEIDSCDYESAAKYFEKIPAKYTDYSISEDVDTLENNITRGQTAYEIFESIEDFITNEDYEAAKEAISILDSSVLSREDEDKLEEYLSKIKKEKVKDDKKSDLDFSVPDAESLLREYCDAFVKAVNNKDFELVAPYMHPKSEIYDQQKELLDEYIAEGITEKFDSLEVNYLTRISDTVWTANVSERITVYYPDGIKNTNQYGWVYTIEYIDSDFYLTKISK